MEVPVDFLEVNNDDELTVTGVVEGIDGINDKLDVTTDELVVFSFEVDTELLSLTGDVSSFVLVDVDDLPVVNVEEVPTVSVDSATEDKLLIDVLAVKLMEGDKDDILSETDETIDADENVIGVVVGIDGSNLVEEEEDISVIPIDGSVEELNDIELPVTGSTMPELAVEDVIKDDALSISLLFFADDSCNLDDEVGSADVSVKSVFLVKLADGESVTYDVEKELLKVLVTVVGVTVGMDDRTDVGEVPVVLSLSCPLSPSPPGSTFLVGGVDADDDS
ncbi:hypothetical protein ACHWQZ_G016361 [Mnemiopsis leidyi]